MRSGQRVTVSGAVKNPSVLTIEGTVTLTMAIAQSGGVSEIGNSDRIHVARTTTGQEVEDRVYNLDDIQAGRAPNPMLHSGDIIVVEDSTTRLALKNVKDAAVCSFWRHVSLRRIGKTRISGVDYARLGLRLQP